MVYQATVTNNKGEQKSYVGLAKNFKKRYRKHKDSLEKIDSNNSTTLSTYEWKEKEKGRVPQIEWKILEKNIPLFNPVTKGCKLCLREKYNIAFNPHLATLNSRNEIFGHCMHIYKRLRDACRTASRLEFPRDIMDNYHLLVEFVHCKPFSRLSNIFIKF